MPDRFDEFISAHVEAALLFSRSRLDSLKRDAIYLRKINDRRCPKPGQGYVIRSASVPMPHPPTYAKHANRQANLIAISMIRRAEPFLLSLQP